MESMKNLLFIQPYASQVGGVDSVLLQLIEGLERGSYNCFVMLPGPSPYVERYEALGAKVLFGPIAVFGKPTDAGYYFRNLILLFKFMLAVRRIIKTYRIDLIHSHKMEVIGANVVGKLLGIPTLQTVHELARKPLFAYRFVAWIDHLANDRIIVLCERSKLMFRWFNKESSKLVKIYNGIASESGADSSAPSLRKQLKLHADDRLLITVARLSPMKGLMYLVEAAARLKRTNPEIKFIIVGEAAFAQDQAHKQELLDRIEALGLKRTVFLLGLRRDVPDLLLQCEALVLPSVYDIFPTVILEAMRAALPVIATDVGGVPEMVREGSGLLIPPEDGEALKQAVLRLMSMNYKQLGEFGRELFLREFVQALYVRRTKDLYEEVLARRNAKPKRQAHSDASDVYEEEVSL